VLAGGATAATLPDLGRADAAELIGNLSSDLVVVYGDESFANARYPAIEGTVHLWSDGKSLWIDD
jgi:hypothetical protein